ncbi:MAG TPA: hypothetical protein VGW40_13365 [Allosphingosinicella sp.]|nr:hypothetical protein [Allosphingosinicella sp.]
MAYYRLYFRDAGPAGPISSFAHFDAAGDHAALAIADGLPGSPTRELWCGARMVQATAEAAATGT